MHPHHRKRAFIPGLGGLVGAAAWGASAVILSAGILGATSGTSNPAERPAPVPAATSLEDVDRAVLLLDEAWIRWTGGAGLEEVADWLESRTEVEWVETADGSLRFQARGAMPLGLVSGGRLSAPEVQVTPGAGMDTLSPPGPPQRSGSVWRGGGGVGGSFQVTPLGMGVGVGLGATPGWGWVGPSDDVWTAARQVRDDHVISDNSDFTVKPFKRALVLGLFDWELGPLETANVSARIGVGREFQCEGCVEVRASDFERVAPTSPRCVAEPDGHCLPVQQTSWRDFLGWESFDLIHVSTHGWQECRRDGSCYTAMATGRIGSRRQSIDGITPEVGAGLRRLHRYDLIRQGVNVVPVGVEYHLMGSPTVCGEPDGGQATRREQRLGGGDPYDHRVTDPNTAAWDQWFLIP